MSTRKYSGDMGCGIKTNWKNSGGEEVLVDCGGMDATTPFEVWSDCGFESWFRDILEEKNKT